MTDKEKEIQAIYIKYAKQGREDCKNMTVEEEKKYIDKMQPKMIAEIKEVVKKYKDANK